MSNTSKKKNTILKDAMVLFLITLVAGLSLGFVYEITLPVIEARQLEAKTAAYKAVYVDAKEFAADDNLTAQASEAASTVLADNGYKNITIDEAFAALDGSGNKIGYVMSVSTQEGYGGTITISLGYSTDGVVQGMEILVLNETAGLGSKAGDESFKSQFAGKQVDKFEYTKTGATEENQIDAISGATITTSAVVDAMNSGLCFINELVEAGNN
jgi:electron transport complex protein RnfG